MDGEGADSITTRRNVLKATAGLGAVGVTGCISNGEEETETRNYYSIIKNEDVTAYDIRTDEVVAWGSTFGDIIGDFLSRIGDESVPATVRIGGGKFSLDYGDWELTADHSGSRWVGQGPDMTKLRINDDSDTPDDTGVITVGDEPPTVHDIRIEHMMMDGNRRNVGIAINTEGVELNAYTDNYVFDTVHVTDATDDAFDEDRDTNADPNIYPTRGLYYNCYAEDSRASGFLLRGNRVRAVGCMATNNAQGSSPPTDQAGIRYDPGEDGPSASITNCMAWDQDGVGNYKMLSGEVAFGQSNYSGEGSDNDDFTAVNNAREP